MRGPSEWQRLFGEAFRLIDEVNAEHPILHDWTFGGGTALMLQIDHRESYDVGLFVPDPQRMAYLRATAADLEFGIDGASYTSDGATHIKIAFEGVGEIDFISAPPVTDLPTGRYDIDGRSVAMEGVGEIVARKVRYRGASIQPRDIFDIAAAAVTHRREAKQALFQILKHVDATLERLGKLERTYVEDTIGQLTIRDECRALAATSYDRSAFQPGDQMATSVRFRPRRAAFADFSGIDGARGSVWL